MPLQLASSWGNQTIEERPIVSERAIVKPLRSGMASEEIGSSLQRESLPMAIHVHAFEVASQSQQSVIVEKLSEQSLELSVEDDDLDSLLDNPLHIASGLTSQRDREKDVARTPERRRFVAS